MTELLTDICKRCEQAVFARSDRADPWRWMHIDVDGVPYRGCRAASYDRAGPDTGWDKSLDRRWTATPVGATT